MLVLIRQTTEHSISTKNNDRTNITIIMIAIVYSIYSHSVHALALNTGSMDHDAGRYCIYTCVYITEHFIKNVLTKRVSNF